jgi:hypothetical protein
MPSVTNVIPFRKVSLKARHKGNTLCRNGHHKWEIEKSRQFDVKQGKLVTLYRCSRCDKTRVKAL